MLTTRRVDHVLTLVHDLDQAAACYRKLGFTLTERGRHAGQGTWNRCIMFGDDYLELFGVEEAGERNASWRTLLEAGHSGPAAMALETEDDEGMAHELVARGLGDGISNQVKRPVRIDGGERDAEFGIVRIFDTVVPWVRLFYCRQFTRDVVWRPEWQSHPNGAVGLGRLVARHPEPQQAAAEFERLFAGCSADVSPDAAEVRLGRTRLVVRRGDTARLTTVGVRVAVIAKAQRCLDQAGVPYMRDGDALVVDAGHAAGTILEFTA